MVSSCGLSVGCSQGVVEGRLSKRVACGQPRIQHFAIQLTIILSVVSDIGEVVQVPSSSALGSLHDRCPRRLLREFRPLPSDQSAQTWSNSPSIPDPRLRQRISDDDCRLGPLGVALLWHRERRLIVEGTCAPSPRPLARAWTSSGSALPSCTSAGAPSNLDSGSEQIARPASAAILGSMLWWRMVVGRSVLPRQEPADGRLRDRSGM